MTTVYVTNTGTLCFDGDATRWPADWLRTSYKQAHPVLIADTEEDAVMLLRMSRAKRSVNSERLSLPFALAVPSSQRLEMMSSYLRRCYRRVKAAKENLGKGDIPPKT